MHDGTDGSSDRESGMHEGTDGSSDRLARGVLRYRPLDES